MPAWTDVQQYKTNEYTGGITDSQRVKASDWNHGFEPYIFRSWFLHGFENRIFFPHGSSMVPAWF